MSRILRHFGSCAILCAVLFCMLPVAGHATIAKTPAGQVYTNPKYKFSMTFPADWLCEEGHGQDPFAAYSPFTDDADTFRENINIIVEQLPQLISLQRYADLSVIQLQKAFKDLKVLDQSQVTIGNTKAVRLIFTATIKNIKLKDRTYLIVDKKQAYVITCSALEGAYAQYADIFENVASTFSLKR